MAKISTQKPPSSGKYLNLTNPQFKSVFGKYADPDALKTLYDEYKKDKTKIPARLEPIVKKAEEDEQALLKAAGEEIPQDILNRNRDKILEISKMTPFLPKGVLLSMDIVPLDHDIKGNPYIPYLPEEVYLDMILNDCNFEIMNFLSNTKMFRDMGEITKRYSALGFSIGGYDESLAFLRNLFGIEEPGKCAQYEFNIETIKEKIATMTNEDFDNYLTRMGMQGEFIEWWKSNRPPEIAERTELSLDEWYNVARKILGVTTDFKIVSMEERGKQAALANISNAVEILKKLDPNYDASQVNLGAVGIVKEGLPPAPPPLEVAPPPGKPAIMPAAKPKVEAIKPLSLEEIKKVRDAIHAASTKK